MIKSIGLLELSSIAKGIECSDSMLKTAEVELVMASPVCPGKYVVIISGDVAAVRASMDTGKALVGEYLIGDFVLASIHNDLIPAMYRAVKVEKFQAMGVVECFSIAAALEGADSAAKDADVDLFEVRLGMGIGGKSYFILIGDVSAVQVAVNAGLKIVEKHGSLVSSVVIPNPRQEVFDSL